MDVGQQEWITRMRLSDYFYLQGVDVLTSELQLEYVNVKCLRDALVVFE